MKATTMRASPPWLARTNRSIVREPSRTAIANAAAAGADAAADGATGADARAKRRTTGNSSRSSLKLPPRSPTSGAPRSNTCRCTSTKRRRGSPSLRLLCRRHHRAMSRLNRLYRPNCPGAVRRSASPRRSSVPMRLRRNRNPRRHLLRPSRRQRAPSLRPRMAQRKTSRAASAGGASAVKPRIA